MNEPCPASKRLGCPDSGTVLVCHQVSPHPHLNHYDAQEQVWWWPSTGVEPELFVSAPLETSADWGGPVHWQA